MSILNLFFFMSGAAPTGWNITRRRRAFAAALAVAASVADPATGLEAPEAATRATVGDAVGDADAAAAAAALPGAAMVQGGTPASLALHHGVTVDTLLSLERHGCRTTATSNTFHDASDRVLPWPCHWQAHEINVMFVI